MGSHMRSHFIPTLHDLYIKRTILKLLYIIKQTIYKNRITITSGVGIISENSPPLFEIHIPI